MEWADAIFPFETETLSNDYVKKIWRTKGVLAKSFISVAATHWELVFATAQDQTKVFLRGPETYSTVSDVPQDADFFGIQFRLGTFLSKGSLSLVVDDAALLQSESRHRFFFQGECWDVPDFENADAFISRLICRGLLNRDALVDDVLQRNCGDFSQRTVQRRFIRATGQTFGQIRQVERASAAAQHLSGGTSIFDVVDKCGFSDQAHLTRALRRFLGKTPGELNSSSI